MRSVYMELQKQNVIETFNVMADDLAEIRNLLSTDIDAASSKYSDFKLQLKELKKKLERKKTQQSLDFYQEFTLLPAISEILSKSLNTRSSSKNKAKIGFSVADADDYVAHWLSDLNG